MLAIIERPDGSTYCQAYDGDFYSLLELKRTIGDDYWIVDIIDTDVSER